MRAVHSEFTSMTMNDDVTGDAIAVRAEQQRQHQQAIAPPAADAAAGAAASDRAGAADRVAASTAASPLSCAVCGRMFRRAENLRRHAASHLQERRYRCPYQGCDRAFYRTDALTRHKAVHKATPRSGGVRCLRACNTCAAARVKCSGSVPCDRCSTKSINCVFLPRMRDRRSSRHRSNDRDEVNQVPSSDATGGGANAVSPAQGPSPQQTVFQQQSNTFVGGASNADISGPMILPDDIFSTGLMDAQGPSASDQFVDDIPAHLQLLSNLPDFATQAGITRSQRSGPAGCAIPEVYFEPNYLSSLNWLSSQFQFAGPEFVRQHGSLNDAAVAAAAAAATAPFPLVQEPPSSGAATNVRRAETNADEDLHTGRSDETTSPSNAQVHTPANSHSQASESDGNSGRLYVEGNGARLPRNGRRRKSALSTAFGAQFELLAGLGPHPVPMAFGFYETALDSLEGPVEYELVSNDIYGDFLQLFDRTCISSRVFPAFSTAFFPSKRFLNRMVSSYFLEFNSVFPVLRPADVQACSRWAPLLLLSMAAIGSHYIEIANIALNSLALHEFVRRCLLLEDACQTPQDDEWHLTYAKLLNCIGLHYSTYRGFEELARRSHSELVAQFHRFNSPRISQSATPNIDAWKRREAQVRTAATIWLLDTMIGYHFQSTPLIPWSTDILLPCKESLWENPHMQTANNMSENVSLQTTLQILYMEKRLPAQAGEFAKICIIHGLYRTLWQVACTLRFPLHSWIPTADRIDCDSLPRETHLHRVPIYQKWRNASCDVIDVLHWRAMSIIAASGTENPTVHHLHYSRIILLSPYENILRLATFMAQGDASNESIDDRNRVHRWTTEDQFKARLAMVHAGVGFWHARRYSTGAFYEPTNIFLTTLAIWAYSLFFDRSQKDVSSQGEGDHQSSQADDQSEGSEDSVVPTFIQLDRPTDDELVQFYVKHGSSMDALISGIGNIQGPDAPVKTLKEGRKILCQMTNWGICTRYIWTLSQLINHCQKPQT